MNNIQAAVTDINNFADQLDANSTNPDTVKGIAANLRTTAEALGAAVEVEEPVRTFDSSL